MNRFPESLTASVPLGWLEGMGYAVLFPRAIAAPTPVRLLRAKSPRAATGKHFLRMLGAAFKAVSPPALTGTRRPVGANGLQRTLTDGSGRYGLLLTLADGCGARCFFLFAMTPAESLLPKYGGYRRLKSFRVAQLAYDLTVRFCDSYIDRRSRTHDQMVQAARSGVQNIAEGSVASGTSKKTELKLTNVARASLEELRLDYEDFLRQRGLRRYAANDPVMKRFALKRCATLEEVRRWVAEEVRRLAETDKNGPARTGTDGDESVSVRSRPSQSVLASELAANAALSLLYVACYLLDKQVAALAKAFEKEGGFTERLYRVRSAKRRNA